MDELFEAPDEPVSLRQALAGLPLDTVIAWDDDSTPAETRFAFSSWLDIQVPLLESVLHWNWMWTVSIKDPAIEPEPSMDFDDIFDEEDEDEEVGETEDDNTSISLAPDGYALVIRDGEDIPLRGVAIYNDGRTISLTEIEIERIYNPHYTPMEIDGRSVWQSAFCDLETINRTLAEWVMQETGRSDIRFRFEPEIGPSPLLQVAIERKEAIEEARERGEQPNYVTMEFDNPEFMAEWLDCTVEQAKAYRIRSDEWGKLVRAAHERDRARIEARSRELLSRV